MNCVNCGKFMRINNEIAYYLPNNQPVYHRVAYCENCAIAIDLDKTNNSNNVCYLLNGIKVDMDELWSRSRNYSNAVQALATITRINKSEAKIHVDNYMKKRGLKKNSGLGIVACILCGIALILPSPFILVMLLCVASIVIATNNIIKSSRKHAIDNAFIIGAAIVIMIGKLICSIPGDVTYTESANTTEKVAENTSEQKTESKVQEAISDGNIIEETEVYNDNGVVVVFKSFKDNTLKFYAENNTDKNIFLRILSFAENNMMIADFAYVNQSDLPSNSKGNFSIKIDRNLNDLATIEVIKELRCCMICVDSDTSETLFESDVICVNTKNYDGKTETIDKELILKENGISYYYMGKVDNKYYLAIQNDNSEIYGFDLDNMTVNSYSYNLVLDSGQTDLYNLIIYPGCYAIAGFYVDNDFKKENDIETIEEISFDFNVRPNDDYYSQIKTGKITIK